MKLNHGLHLAYCTNVHPGENWAQTFDSLNRWTLAVKNQLDIGEEFAIGLRLSDEASRELLDSQRLREFQRWLETHHCYVFTINGFPFGQFHGGRVKEQVYLPDWTSERRVQYTNRLFDLLAALMPPGLEGSVSTLPGSFKEFIRDPDQAGIIQKTIWRCVEHISHLSERTGRLFHLGLEPEPLGLFENTDETVRFFDELRSQHPGDARLSQHLGVNYDTCHFAVEFESAREAIARLRAQQIRISKIHISNALKLCPSAAALDWLAAFADDVYLHQVIIRQKGGGLTRFKDLPLALNARDAMLSPTAEEWRVHFHVPLHWQPPPEFGTTSDHVIELFDLLQLEPGLCSHLEMETYTWAVLPDALRARDVSQQIIGEYRWTLQKLLERGLAPSPAIAKQA
jgi:hypothetical protein